MKIVGLTGGIGSGKTTVAKMFEALGVPIYIADDEAKKLTVTSAEIKEKLINLFGEIVYQNNVLNKSFLADKIFNNQDLLSQVNAIIHPVVATHFLDWVKNQDVSYVIKEAAILFESGSYKDCDVTILVTAPIELRLARVKKRDNATDEEIMSRINNQWSDEKKSKLADIILENIDIKTTKNSVLEIHQSLIL